MLYTQINLSGPILIIEDDEDDQLILTRILKELNLADKVIYFSTPIEALDYLQQATVHPFILICDINMPMINGIEFKKQIDQDPVLKAKCTPFIFWSTSISDTLVHQAYTETTIQGFFQKSCNYNELKQQLYYILGYWYYCQHPVFE
ncbi:response regulator [Xanthocytophaga flava]|uniref:response regulator n=1 Tax=Xanthocytophaga flava TaxID=3048013 RepID=UPI0028D0C82C|nr:response regulator [Xanthocytophaga flavus]MDJ1470782.1 response regulator [Xanthocytophaga flavus]